MPDAIKIRFRMSCHAGNAGMVGTFSYQVAQNLIAQGYAVAVRDGASTPKAVSPKPAAPPSTRDLNTFVLVSMKIGYGKQMWFVPNSEWFRSEWLQYVPQFSRVLCKTMDGYNIWNEKAPGRTS